MTLTVRNVGMTSLRRALGLSALAVGLTYASHAATVVVFTWVTMRKYRGLGLAGPRLRDHLPPYMYRVRKAQAIIPGDRQVPPGALLFDCPPPAHQGDRNA